MYRSVLGTIFSGDGFFSPSDFTDEDTETQRGGLGCPRSGVGNGSHGIGVQGSMASKARKKRWEVHELNLKF